MLTAEEVRAMFSYNKDTGILVWAIPKTRSVKVGSNAGCLFTNKVTGKAYYRVSINSKNYLVHRVIWLLVTGSWPEHQIDHENGNGIDNRWCNLRQATSQVNNSNAKQRKDNRSGCTGVFWVPQHQYWLAYINYQGKRKNLGCYIRKDEAISVRKLAEVEYGFHPNHGTINK